MKKTIKHLIGKTIINVGDDWIQLDDGCRIYLTDDEVDWIGIEPVLEYYEQEIYDAIFQIYSNPSNKDRYGQVGINNYTASNLKNRMSADAFDYLEKGHSKYGKLQTYGGSLGIYKAVNPTSAFYKQTKTK